MKAYVLIQTRTGQEPVAQKLRTIPGVVSAEDLRGPYDAIALAQSGSTPHLIEEVGEEIRRLPGVTLAIPAPMIRSVPEGTIRLAAGTG